MYSNISDTGVLRENEANGAATNDYVHNLSNLILVTGLAKKNPMMNLKFRLLSVELKPNS